MDPDELKSFLAIARLGTFTRAAQERHLTQPGLSRQIQRLERKLGVVLLERRRGPLSLTPAGQRFRRYAEEAVEQHHRLLHELQQENRGLIGELRIAASSTPGEFLVPDLVAGFTARHQEVHPQVFIADSSQVIHELRERHWELGFVGARLPGRGLEYRLVAEDEVVLAVPDGHPFAARGEVHLADLEGQPFLEREGGSGTLLSVQSALTYRKLPAPRYRVVMVLSTTQAIVSAVESGYGIGLVSSLALEHRRSDRVARVRLAELPRRRQLYMVQEHRRLLSPVAGAFAQWVHEQGAVSTPRNGGKRQSHPSTITNHTSPGNAARTR